MSMTPLDIVLDRLADGMIIVDDRAQVLHANRPARELLDRVRARAAGTGELSFTHARTQRAFLRALRDCSAPARDADDPVPHEFLVLDARCVTIARASVEPLRRRSGGDRAADTHLVSLHPQPDEAQVSTESLCALYGMTPCEARVAVQVMTVRSPNEIATRLALSRNTVKSHMKSIFRKCEINSLAQLAALVATGPRGRRQFDASMRNSAANAPAPPG